VISDLATLLHNEMNSNWEGAFRVPVMVHAIIDPVDEAYKWEGKPTSRRSA
jgi:hypothetical protein